MHFLSILQQPRPKFLFHRLLLKLEHHIPTRMMCLALLHIDLVVEYKLDMVGCFLGV